jgi:seryl-tRNA synthetase
VRNEAERMQLQAQVEVSQSELEQLRLVARELEASLEQKKDAYKQLKKDIAQLDAESDQLRQDLEECEDELDQTQMLLQQKLLTIEQLEKETGQMAQRDRQEEKPKKAATTYKAVRGDLTDEVLARLLKDIKLLVPLARICEGWYLFGTRKIFA